MGKAKDVLTEAESSAFRRYQDLVVGSRSLLFMARYELTLLLSSWLPGAPGLVLRQLLYPGLFAEVGPGTVFGQNVTIRNSRKIRIGEAVVVDAGSVLDGRSEHEVGLRIGPRTMIARNTQIQSKGGRIAIGENVGIGSNTVIHTIRGNSTEIGDDVLIGPYAYVGGTMYRTDRLDVPIQLQGTDPKGGVRIGKGTWLGTSVTVMDGIRIGRDAIVAAGAVVTKDVPDYAIVGGVPARMVRSRVDKSGRARRGRPRRSEPTEESAHDV